MARTSIFTVVLICALAVGAFASSSPYQPPEGGDEWQKITVVLKGTKIDKDARGTAVFACNMAETFHRIQLQASKVVKNGVYSVWLVKLSKDKKKVIKQTRLDDSKKRLKADKYGKLSFTSNINSCPMGKYNQVQVRYHKDGKSRNIKGARAALVGDIK